MKRSFRYWLGTALVSIGVTAQANVTASLDQDQVANGDTVQLTLQRDRSGGGDPDLTPLKKDFDILGTSTATSVQYINGQLSQQHQVQLTLSPKHGGTIEIPALSWAGEQTAPLQLTVAASSGGGGGGSHAASDDSQDSSAPSSHVFLTDTLDSAAPYVQGAAVLTVRLHADQTLQRASLDFQGNADVTVQSIGKDQQSSEIRNGHRYSMVERRYLLLPQRSGAVTLEGPTLDAQVADTRGSNPFNDDSFFSGTPFAGLMGTLRPLRIHGDPIRLDVQPRPASATGSIWLPAKQITLEQSRTPQTGSVHAGEPLSLHLKLQATGLTASQLPDLSQLLVMPEGLKAYPDQAKLDTSIQSGALVSTREQDIALIATQGGTYNIPPVHVSWWDSTQKTARDLTLQIAPIEIAAAAGGSAAVAQPPSAASSEPAPKTVTPSAGSSKDSIGAIHLGDGTPGRQPPWMWISAAFALLWLATMALLWKFKRRSGSRPAAPTAPRKTEPTLNASSARSTFHQACKDNMPHLARRHLLNWASQTWPSNPPKGLESISAVINDSRLSQLLEQLDRACFIGGEWVGEPLAAKLTTLPREPARAGKIDSPLQTTLYP